MIAASSPAIVATILHMNQVSRSSPPTGGGPLSVKPTSSAVTSRRTGIFSLRPTSA
jgi:hypothetical protein